MYLTIVVGFETAHIIANKAGSAVSAGKGERVEGNVISIVLMRAMETKYNDSNYSATHNGANDNGSNNPSADHCGGSRETYL